MHITITRTGKKFFHVDDTLAALLLEAGIAERVVTPAPAQRPVTFSIIENTSNSEYARRWIICRRSYRGQQLNEESFFDGDPDRALQVFRDIPVEVVENYRRANAPIVGVPAEVKEQQRIEFETKVRRQNTMGISPRGTTATLLPVPETEN